MGGMYWALADQAVQHAEDYKEVERIREKMLRGDSTAQDDLKRLKKRLGLDDTDDI
jgi:hypothetical protein